MDTQETYYRGIVLKESLATGDIPSSLLQFISTTYPYMLDRLIPATVFKLEIPSQQVNEAAWTLAGKLLHAKYFAQLTSSNQILVIFPNTLVRVMRDIPETAENARRIGTCFGIPRHQMQFEKMFERDHPNIE